MTTKKPAFSTRLNQFWAKMLAPINAYLGSALIIIALGMALVGLSGGHMGGHVDILAGNIRAYLACSYFHSQSNSFWNTASKC